MTSKYLKLKKEFDERFCYKDTVANIEFVRTFDQVSKDIWQFIEKALQDKEKEKEIIEEMKKLGNVKEYISAYGNVKGESAWVKISEVRLKIDKIIDNRKED